MGRVFGGHSRVGLSSFGFAHFGDIGYWSCHPSSGEHLCKNLDSSWTVFEIVLAFNMNIWKKTCCC